jgi:hypothetical protein
MKLKSGVSGCLHGHRPKDVGGAYFRHSFGWQL